MPETVQFTVPQVPTVWDTDADLAIFFMRFLKLPDEEWQPIEDYLKSGKPVIGLPGNPVSAMVQFDMLGRPAIHQLLGLSRPAQQGLIWATLTTNVASQSGREDYVPTRLEKTADGYQATPVFGKSNLIYTLVNADGLMKIPLDKGGLLAGELVEVRLF